MIKDNMNNSTINQVVLMCIRCMYRFLSWYNGIEMIDSIIIGVWVLSWMIVVMDHVSSCICVIDSTNDIVC